MDQVRWGIMGAGGIARRFARALEQVEGARLVAVSGRRAERLDAFAEEFPVDEARRYASVEDDGASAHARLAENPDVDAVYLALPHGMHEVWAARLLRAGKAVLCEKPAVLSEREALHIAEVARETGTLFMEAMKPRFMPAREQVKALIEGGELGAVTSLDIAHRVDYGDQTGRYLLDAAQGGTLYDLGCYGVAWAEDVLAGEAEVEACRTRWMAASDGASSTSPMTCGCVSGACRCISTSRAMLTSSRPSAASSASAARSRFRCCTARCRISSGAMGVRTSLPAHPPWSTTSTARSRTSATLSGRARRRAPSCRWRPPCGTRGSSTRSALLGSGMNGVMRAGAMRAASKPIGRWTASCVPGMCRREPMGRMDDEGPRFDAHGRRPRRDERALAILAYWCGDCGGVAPRLSIGDNHGAVRRRKDTHETRCPHHSSFPRRRHGNSAARRLRCRRPCGP